MKTSINALINDTTLANEMFEFTDVHAARSSLNRRMDMQIPKIRFLVKENLIDGDKCYLTFTNIAPETGGTYDDTVIHTLPTRGNPSKQLGRWSFQTWGHVVGGTSYFITVNEDGTETKHDYQDWKALKNELKTNEELRALVRATFNPNYVEPVVEEVVAEEKPEKVVKVKATKATTTKAPAVKKSRKKPEVKVETVNEDDVIV